MAAPKKPREVPTGPSMFAFWELLLEPLARALKPERILEIGSDRGTTTRALLDFAEAHGAVLHAIDPSPGFEAEDWQRSHPDSFVFHYGLSLKVLPGLNPVQLALIDGDHNWYTVLNELRLIEKAALNAGETPSVVALHDIGWPYGRRDLYYEPDDIPAAQRRDYERRGIRPDSDELVDDGLNGHLANATTPASEHSGVRGAVDDFIAESDQDWRFFEVPGQHGLGVLAPAALLDERGHVKELLEQTSSAEFLRRRVAAVERDRIETEIRRAQAARAARKPVIAADEERASLERTIDELRAQADTGRYATSELREMLEERELEMRRIVSKVAGLQACLGRERARAEIAQAERSALERRFVELVALHEMALRDLSVPSTPLAPAESTGAAFSPSAGERKALESFAAEYRPLSVQGVDPLALPVPRDLRGMLRVEGLTEAAGPSVDIVVCVHNALDDVRRCLWSLLHKASRPFRLILVDDGSDAATAEYLREAVAANPGITLIENASPPHGYTIAANLGMREASGDYVVVLNSDTIVTHDWLERIVACGESSERIGILGPLSNAASHQSIPELRDGGSWATNPLPPFVTEDGIARLLDRTSSRTRPRLPFINGFCYVVKRSVFQAIGYFDEENFASGYCEENDFSYRAAQAGFELAVADDAYVFHAKSKSFTPEVRKQIATRNYEIFLGKHGAEEIKGLVKDVEASTALNGLRAEIAEALSGPEAFTSALDARAEPLEVAFILPGLGVGGSGGSHSIYQEVKGLRGLGVPARMYLPDKLWSRAVATYEDADEVFDTFGDLDELTEKTAAADVISATHYKSVEVLAELHSRREDFLPAYYIQDYEPFFTTPGSADLREAVASYAAVPGCLLFAKTHWLCNIVGERHGLHVAKVEPSLDGALFRPANAPRGGPLRVVAMIRPRTPRRQPSATLAVLETLRRRLGEEVELVTFGCAAEELASLTSSVPLLANHQGLLTRREVAALLSQADVFLDMSTYQAFGRTALEAMACGCTAVVPRLGGVWEFLVDGVNGTAVDTVELDGAIEALTELAMNRDRLRSLQLAAGKTAKRYSIGRAALSEYLVFSQEHARRFGRDRATA